ncbi:ABC transporter permease [Acrocarpospora pleiomorpha]|uniref:ABC transporter permease n=1 Tax=Acrocarpospora pleiomorpha TaxID=90975 RepID=A0A5M3X9F0_9ACTN|nr:sugar ABC transporter permease [Acrocarpospora pleiomorpha]GES18355.1 ABC transporter permease [Acrocarpospora pleiomorpha]
MLRDRRAILLFIGPPLAIYTLMMLLPIVWSFGYTFFEGNALTGFSFTGQSNYTKIFHDDAFWAATWVTLRYSVLVTIGQVGAGLFLALMYVFYLRRTSSVIRTLVFFPVVLPTVAVAQMFVKLFQVSPQNGLVNSVLEGAGMGSHVQDWLGTPSGAFWILIGMDIWRSMGFYAILLYAGLVDVPEDIIESARLDGASGWKLTRHIVLPLLTPILVSSIIFSINGTLKVFDSVLALTKGGPGETTTPLTLYMYNTAFTYGDYGYGSTIAMSLTILSLAVTLVIFRTARKDVRL